jgi:hypothetical protein
MVPYPPGWNNPREADVIIPGLENTSNLKWFHALGTNLAAAAFKRIATATPVVQRGEVRHH